MKRRDARQVDFGQGTGQAVAMKPIAAPSPNFDDRKLPISMIVLHYTGMRDAASAIARLRDPEAKVSAHYVVDEDGTVSRLVDEEKRAWHAGRSHWRDITDVNSASIGIEIVNPGHEWGYVPFPEEQMDAITRLAHSIVQRHGITATNVIGHSDLAPARKQDPGELFDWARLANAGLGLWPRAETGDKLPQIDPRRGAELLAEFGYETVDLHASATAFQRHFRPARIDGELDGDCMGRLLALTAAKPSLDGGDAVA